MKQCLQIKLTIITDWITDENHYHMFFLTIEKSSFVEAATHVSNVSVPAKF